MPNPALTIAPPSPVGGVVDSPEEVAGSNGSASVASWNEGVLGAGSAGEQDNGQTLERPLKIQRCSLCHDFDDLLETYLEAADELEKTQQKVLELQAILASQQNRTG